MVHGCVWTLKKMRSRRLRCSTRSFYGIFLSVVAIFCTIVYIQIVSNFNIPLERSLNEDGVEPVTYLTRLENQVITKSRAFGVKGNESRSCIQCDFSANDQGITDLNKNKNSIVSFKNNSRLVTQHVIRTQGQLEKVDNENETGKNREAKFGKETNVEIAYKTIQHDVIGKFMPHNASLLTNHDTVNEESEKSSHLVPQNLSVLTNHDAILRNKDEASEEGRRVVPQNTSVLSNPDAVFNAREEKPSHSNESDVVILGKLPLIQAIPDDANDANMGKDPNMNKNNSNINLLKLSEVQVGAIINETVKIERNVTRFQGNYVVRNETLEKSLDANRERLMKRPNYCPLWPSELVGPLDVENLMNLTEIPEANRNLIKDGGHFIPPDCRPRERTAVIIPYRDRTNNLALLLRHLHTVLQRQKIEYGIFVVEMAYPTQFNRGLLANVGFLTASSTAAYTCYIIHDVDLLMTDDRNMYRCGRVPRHLTATNTKYKSKLPYLAYFGGVEAFTPEQFWKLNGFSNLYFGWGGEDDDMVYRIFGTDQHFSRPRPQIGGYVAIEHESDSANPPNPHRINLVKSAVKRMSEDGVKTVSYSRLALEFKPLYTWVYIAAKEARIMDKFQKYLEET